MPIKTAAAFFSPLWSVCDCDSDSLATESFGSITSGTGLSADFGTKIVSHFYVGLIMGLVGGPFKRETLYLVNQFSFVPLFYIFINLAALFPVSWFLLNSKAQQGEGEGVSVSVLVQASGDITHDATAALNCHASVLGDS